MLQFVNNMNARWASPITEPALLTICERCLSPCRTIRPGSWRLRCAMKCSARFRPDSTMLSSQ